MGNAQSIPGVLELYYENRQDYAAIAEILGLASMEEDNDEKEMPEEDSPDEDRGFHIDCLIHH
jgi:hypothetical protein